MNPTFLAAIRGWAFTGLLLTPLLAQAESGAADASATKRPAPRFAAPVELTADGKPFRGILYPSPTLHDTDGDGKRELWIGDLPGHVKVARPAGGEHGGFGPLKSAKTRDGKLLKLQNW